MQLIIDNIVIETPSYPSWKLLSLPKGTIVRYTLSWVPWNWSFLVFFPLMIILPYGELVLFFKKKKSEGRKVNHLLLQRKRSKSTTIPLMVLFSDSLVFPAARWHCSCESVSIPLELGQQGLFYIEV